MASFLFMCVYCIKLTPISKINRDLRETSIHIRYTCSMEEQVATLLLVIIMLLVPIFRRAYFLPRAEGEEITQTTRDSFIDLIRGFAIIGVVIIHVIYFFYVSFPYNDPYLLNLTNGFMRFAIPFFFITSGLLLKPPAYSANGICLFYWHKFIKLGVPYLLMMLGLLWYADLSLREFFFQTIQGTGMVPYYFIIVLFQFYLIYPIIYLWRNSRIFLYVSFVISLIAYITPAFAQVGEAFTFLPFLFFFVYGLYYRPLFLDDSKRVLRQNVPVWILLSILFFIPILIKPVIYFNTRFIWGIAAFNLLFAYKDSLLRLPQYLRQFFIQNGKASLWIFLTHFPITFIVFDIFQKNVDGYYLQFILSVLLALPASFVAGYVFQTTYNFLSTKIFK
ncbi:MAG: hypothetical protein COV95_00655 [Candidatus Zambryskibacteria bacterium CG11_big_fil_rev_8_21_14_0_20_40_24]|uniref:Acyltransferase 3 domain-containing protein n=2 Tax=Candidatus Zambryskiibacteriota TaxID=1817925 RepID=A0A2H0K749_9BACT|nr:MAG: hypothetical protein COV95_00655 [Candidatus Zambryskibacteria bacterium CG11_big_fil_rev_8_21_14_0_20_40_24]